MKSAKSTIQHGPNAGEWLMDWSLELSEIEHMSLSLRVKFVHPSPRISDLERATLERAVTLLQAMLEQMPARQDR